MLRSYGKGQERLKRGRERGLLGSKIRLGLGEVKKGELHQERKWGELGKSEDKLS